jgi:hypothetical protein
MGCGGSIQAEDGSLLPGKGETKQLLDPDQKLKILMYWTGEGTNFATELKPASGKEALTGKWEVMNQTQGKHALWMDVVPGSWQQRYVIDELRTQYPDAFELGLPEKIFALHAVDPNRFGPLCVSAAKQSKEEHAYKAANGADLAKADLDALAAMVSAHQISENLQPLKKALCMIEDTMPGNMVDASASFSFDLGFWDKNETGEIKRVTSATEGMRLMAEAKLSNPVTAKQIALKGAEIARKMIIQTMDTACSMIKVPRPDLLPQLEAQLDVVEGRRPGSTPKPQGEGEKAPDTTAEQHEEEKLRMIEKLWGLDKPLLDQKRREDSQPPEAAMKQDEADCDRLSATLKKHYSSEFKAADVSNSSAGLMVMARYKNTDLFEALAKQVHQDGSLFCEFPQNKLEIAETEWVYPKDKIKKKVFFPPPVKEIEVERVNVSYMPPNPTINDLFVGCKVRVQHATNAYFYDATVVDVNHADKTADVKDRFYEVEKGVKCENMWLKSKLSTIAARPRLMQKNFYDCQFWWVAAQEAGKETTVTLNVWRTGFKDESLQQVVLTPVTMAAKPTKAVPNPTHDVHIGWKGTVPLLIERSYSMNYLVKVGEVATTYLDFGKPAKCAEAYRRFSVKINV